MPKPVICIGAALIDELYHAHNTMMLHTTNEVTVTHTAGGVSRNLAHQLSLLDVPVQLITVFGNDQDVTLLKNICFEAAILLAASITAPAASGKHTAIISEDGSLFTALLTNSTLHLITTEYLLNQEALLKTGSFILVDANIDAAAITWLIEFTNLHHISMILEPVAVSPAKKIASVNFNGLYLITPNGDELPALCSAEATNTEEQNQGTTGQRHSKYLDT